MSSDRYSRQTMLPQFGEDGQEKLTDASVLIIGAGGLGTPIMFDLASAGVGTIGLADNDIIKESNLNRQYIHFEEDIGSLKVNSAAAKLRALNSDISVIPHDTAINKDNAYELISQYDVVALAVDNVQARMIVNDSCVQLGIPFADGGVNGFVGTATFIDPAKTPCLACLYGTAQPPEENFGAISPVVGMIANLEATAILQYLLGLEVPMSGKLIAYDAAKCELEKIDIQRDPNCPICSHKNK